MTELEGTAGQDLTDQWNPASKDFQRQLEGYGLTTAQILYRRPDHPWLLQTYVWQEYDLCPKFPVLNGFLPSGRSSWKGRCTRCTVAHSRLIKPAEIRAIDGEFRLHWAGPPKTAGEDSRGFAG